MIAKIEDEFSGISSKSARRYFRLKRDGLCVRCGNDKPVKGYLNCKTCRKAKREHFKKTYKPKQPRKYTPRPSKYL